MRHLSKLLYVPAAVGGSLALLLGMAFAGTAAAASVIYVAPGGNIANAGTSCASAQYSTIGDGVTAAAAQGTVVVCAGTYDEMVTVDKALTLTGQSATIDASGYDNGILITHSWVSVAGFKVENATGEGILAMGTPESTGAVSSATLTSGTPIARVSIEHNVVRNNDQGGPQSSYLECQPNGQIPGDCGEGIHLMSVSSSKVRANLVTGNSGGILLTDEFGPTHDNLIARNVVTGNAYDCGITLASHNAGWNPGTQSTDPSFAGVYHNTIRRNVIHGNGLKGEGAGVLIAAAFPLAASYDNHVIGNTITGNDLAGVTIHSHPGGGYISDNVVAWNRIGRNNLGGDPDAGVPQTTGILVYSTDQPANVTINHNLIYKDHFGIWYSSSTVSPSMLHNTFVHVAVPVKNG